jgi:hypothetical protein
VGSEPASRTARDEARDEDGAEAFSKGSAAVSAGRDTVSPVTYHVFDRTPIGTSGDRAVFRVLVLVPAAPEVLGKTLRLALDSLGRSEPGLVAARAILYTVRPGGSMKAQLTPRVWGEWVPPEGWEAAAASARRKPYRTYIYLGDPGWNKTTAAANGRP